ncbi:sulfatase family protein [Pontiella sulfatireligans]|uniref:Choline-sulfatase n=1 Tax=Pontiella sulfatireligans TaxID=2750658 RepID=A0A6C2UNU1_9BACT|nr:sulfatase [Pontiella sulfatireligans]SPS74477.1 sulfatase S1_8 [Kiritimatiellales bacterium]VGO21932.1 Choline-sulfatase [Pontiella sulfatireligans]
MNIRISMMMLTGLLGCCLPAQGGARTPDAPLNILLVTVDDMNWDTPGCYGNPIPNITPNIDALAERGLRFGNAYVTHSICGPSRATMLTGLLPSHHGATGSCFLTPGIVPITVPLKAAGYYTGIYGKDHIAPLDVYDWDEHVHHIDGLPEKQITFSRHPDVFGREIAGFIERAKKTGKPFFLMANPEDPHRPFANGPKIPEFIAEGKVVPPVTRIIGPDEVPVPDFLPDLPEVRRELGYYYTSAFRGDQVVGKVFQALEESGVADRTLVIFLSDNGMPFPMAKGETYLNSNRVPMIAMLPGMAAPGGTYKGLLSSTDIAPTILEAAGVPDPGNLDGWSFLPLLKGSDSYRERDFVVNEFHMHGKIGGRQFDTPYPIRCIQTKQFRYLVTFWSDGETNRELYVPDPCDDAMAIASKTNHTIAVRYELFHHRVREELFDTAKDPQCLQNLIGNPEYAAARQRLRERLADDMLQRGDSALEAFLNLYDDEKRREFLQAEKAFLDRKVKIEKEHATSH